MTAKNTAAKTWSITPSYDLRRYSGWPAGDKPTGFQSAPTILSTDIIYGSLTGGENNKGAYLSIFGYSLGQSTNIGTSAGAQVWFRDPLGDNTWHEVDNYRGLVKSLTHPRNQAMHLRCQIGSLGGSQVAGRVLDLRVTVNGVSSNVLTNYFTIQPGNFYFVSLTGNDSTGVVNDITHPYRYAQKYDTVNNVFTGIWAPGVLKPGDTIVIRGGSYSDAVGFDGRWIRFWRDHTSSAPNGTVGNGGYHFTAYPTSTGNELVQQDGGDAGAGIQGVDTARALLGFGARVTMSGLHIKIGANAVRDSAPINIQNGANYWRVHDCECGPWPSAVTAPNSAKAAGISGEGKHSVFMFNYVHDIDCDALHHSTSAFENHGFYFGGASGGTGYESAAQDIECAYNWVYNIPGGSGIQFYWQNPANVVTSIFINSKVHHNYVDTVQKYGINTAESSVSIDVYNNIVCNTGLNSLHLNCLPYGAGVNPLNINFSFNTCYNWNLRGSPNDSAFATEGYVESGTVKVTHNIFAGAAGRTTTNSWYINNGASDTNLTMSQNLYYDFAGTLTGSAAKDSSPITTNPNFTSIAGNDFTCQTGGGGVDAVTTTPAIAATVDYYGIVRPQGAHKDIGACEGVGT